MYRKCASCIFLPLVGNFSFGSDKCPPAGRLFPLLLHCCCCCCTFSVEFLPGDFLSSTRQSVRESLFLLTLHTVSSSFFIWICHWRSGGSSWGPHLSAHLFLRHPSSQITFVLLCVMPELQPVCHMYLDIIRSLTVATDSFHETDTWYLKCARVWQINWYPLTASYTGECGPCCLWMLCYACRYVG